MKWVLESRKVMFLNISDIFLDVLYILKWNFLVFNVNNLLIIFIMFFFKYFLKNVWVMMFFSKLELVIKI